jgi:P pilus assembly chaperone PapD
VAECKVWLEEYCKTKKLIFSPHLYIVEPNKVNLIQVIYNSDTFGVDILITHSGRQEK